MNLPVTNPVVKNVPLEKIDVPKLFTELCEKNFEGYSYLTILGKYGFEESILILSKGKVIGSMFLIAGYDVELYGKDAMSLCLNCYGSNNGILNLFGLSDDQTKLILLFNDKINHTINIVDKKKNFLFKNLKYTDTLLNNLLKEKIKEEKTKKQILNEFNLNDLLKE